MSLRDFTSVKERRIAVEHETGVELPNIGVNYQDEATASKKNCENMIGVTQIPLGIAGPLLIKHQEPSTKNHEKSYFIPLATTEGALVASVNRGCKVIREAGGVEVFVERVGTTRGPVFNTGSLRNSRQLEQWLYQHQDLLNTIAQQTSSHIRLLSQLVHIDGPLLFVRWAFDTQDAMGMNMVTIASEAIGRKVAEETNVRFLSVSGNFCVDKKPSWLNVVLGRGFRAWSEFFLPTNVITDVLKTTPEVLHTVWQSKCLIGSAASGSMGFNGHAANVIAALFLATGQDIAHVVEGSTGTTSIHNTKDGIIVSLSLPSMMVGTVGGGTALATQKEALMLLGISGGNDGKNAETLAGIVAGAVLAGEVSELAALANHTLACAHQILGRGKK